MIQEFLDLRNNLHKGEFRFDLKPELWRVNYVERPGIEEDGIIKIYRQGNLEGYAICSLSELKASVKMLQVLEFCATEKEVMDELLTKVTAKGNEKGADFITLAQYNEPFADLLATHEFVDFTGFTVMAALLNPKELLVALSAENISGRRLNLEINGFSPISLVVGEDKIKVIEYDPKAEVVLAMSDKAFVNAFFGKTSLLGELLKGEIKVKGKVHLNLAMKFFGIIKQRKAYIPIGDGI